MMNPTMAVVATLILCISALQTAFAQEFMDRSFEQRLRMYSDWTTQLQSKGRSLASSPMQAPAPGPSGVFPMPGYGYCKVLRYHTGYANQTLYFDKVIKDSPNFGECCKSCSADPSCQAWTRVAGGDGPNFRNCYLKYRLYPDGFDMSPNKFDSNHAASDGIHANDATKYPELRYVNTNSPVILESGTKPDVYPAEYYGCPYNDVATTPCVAPPGCNVDGAGNQVYPLCL